MQMNKKFCTYILFCAAVCCAHAQLPSPSACYTFTGNANDGTGNGHNGTVNGATLVNDRFGNANSAYSFNGTNSYIAIPNFNTLVSSDEVTISFWAKANGFQTQAALLLAPDNTSDRMGIFIYYNQGSNAYHFWDYGDILTPNSGRVSVATSYVSQWEHFVCVTSQSQNFMAVYKNGVLMSSENHSAPLVNKNKTLNIGGGTSFPFDGLIDDVAIYNQVLTPSQINQVYQAANPCAPPPPAVPAACYPFSGNAIDATGNGHNGTVCGATLAPDRLGNPNSAYLFDGVDDSIAVPNFNTIIPNDEFTITFWIKANNFKSQLAFMLTPDNTGDRLCIPIYYDNVSSPYHILDYGDIFNNGRIGITTTFISQWEHFACVVSQSLNLMAIYKNGALLHSENHSAPLVNKNKTFNIGGGIGSQGENFFYDGLIDDVVIYNQALSASEIMQVYNSGVSCLSTAVSEPETSTNVVVYPNPSEDGVYQIRFGNSLEKTYCVYNCLGENILSGKMNSNISFNLSAFPQGIYYLQVLEGKKLFEQKIIKL